MTTVPSDLRLTGKNGIQLAEYSTGTVLDHGQRAEGTKRSCPRKAIQAENEDLFLKR